MVPVFDKVFVIFLVFNFHSFVRAVSREDLKGDNIDRGSRSDRGGLWFGPRLGKRSLIPRSEGNSPNLETFLRLLEAADALKYYHDQLPYYDSQAETTEPRVSKKVIFTPKLGRSLNEDKRHEIVDFKPRLGRRISQPPLNEQMYQPDSEADENRMHQRLGRNDYDFRPRLGRELDDMYPENTRVARSANKKKN